MFDDAIYEAIGFTSSAELQLEAIRSVQFLPALASFSFEACVELVDTDRPDMRLVQLAGSKKVRALKLLTFGAAGSQRSLVRRAGAYDLPVGSGSHAAFVADTRMFWDNEDLPEWAHCPVELSEGVEQFKTVHSL